MDNRTTGHVTQVDQNLQKICRLSEVPRGTLRGLQGARPQNGIALCFITPWHVLRCGPVTSFAIWIILTHYYASRFMTCKPQPEREHPGDFAGALRASNIFGAISRHRIAQLSEAFRDAPSQGWLSRPSAYCVMACVPHSGFTTTKVCVNLVVQNKLIACGITTIAHSLRRLFSGL